MPDTSTIQRVVANGQDVDTINNKGTSVWTIASGNPYAFAGTKVWGKFNSRYAYKSGSYWYYDDDDSQVVPCTSPWTASPGSLTCSRTIGSNYPASSYTYYNNSYGGPGGPYWWSNGDCSYCINGYSSAGHCHRDGCCPSGCGGATGFASNCWSSPAGWGYYQNFTNCGLTTGYTCPSGGSLSGTTCINTTTETQPFAYSY